MISGQQQGDANLPRLEQIAQCILFVRGSRVILDSDLAKLYGAETKRLNEKVKRNSQRFPEDFCFQLTPDEYAALRSQFATSKGRGGRRYMPYVFTEHGALMISTLLNTPTAIEVSLYVVRAFVRLRVVLATNQQLAARLSDLEYAVGEHDGTIRDLVEALRQLMAPPEPGSKRGIGFAPWED